MSVCLPACLPAFLSAFLPAVQTYTGIQTTDSPKILVQAEKQTNVQKDQYSQPTPADPATLEEDGGSLGEASSAGSHSITPVQAAAVNEGERPQAASEGSMPEPAADPVKEQRRGSTPGPAKPAATGQKKKGRLREARKRRSRSQETECNHST